VGQYCVNKSEQSNGDHEVHEQGCMFWPLPHNVLPLGWYSNCADAVKTARSYYRQVNGCWTCCRPCHTQ